MFFCSAPGSGVPCSAREWGGRAGLFLADPHSKSLALWGPGFMEKEDAGSLDSLPPASRPDLLLAPAKSFSLQQMPREAKSGSPLALLVRPPPPTSPSHAPECPSCPRPPTDASPAVSSPRLPAAFDVCGGSGSWGPLSATLQDKWLDLKWLQRPLFQSP